VTDRVDQTWNYHAERLGAPDSVQAVQRADELTAAGWELLSVHFTTGIWRFRRPRPPDPSTPRGLE